MSKWTPDKEFVPVPVALSQTPWDELSDKILAALRDANMLRASKIAETVDAPEELVQAKLIALDDQERVLERNGWYSLSTAERAKGV